MRKQLVWAVFVILCLSVAVSLPGQVEAQSAMTYSAGNQWGTAPSGVGVNGALDSSIAHNQNSAIAAAVSAARRGLLIGTGSTLNITSVGSQSIVSNTVIGNNNGSTNITASQTSSNSGSVSNIGTIVSP